MAPGFCRPTLVCVCLHEVDTPAREKYSLGVRMEPEARHR